MRLILVRHGETEANVKGLIQGGGSNFPLTKNGIEQAKEVSEFLKNEKIDIAYSSDLKRALQTAKEILKNHKLKLTKTKELRESHAGELEGKKKTSNGKSFFPSYKSTGGESLLDCMQRVSDFYDKVKQEDQTILFVSHGVSIGTLLLYIFKKKIIWEEYDQCRPPVAGITILEINKNRIKKILWNHQIK
jgi:broad specificity phosphatase PhoE